MSVLEDLLEYLVKGTLLIVILSFAAVIFAPFALGLAISIIFWRVIDAIYSIIFPKKEERIYHPREEDLKRLTERIEQGRQLAEEKETSEPELPPRESEVGAVVKEVEHKEIEEESALDKNLYLERKLTFEQREALFAKGYKRLKISPYGTSGAAYYWVKPRYNESKEHAFFCYLVEAEVKKHAKELKTNVTYGPDVEFEHLGLKYCVDVETGTNTERNPAFLNKKFAYYNREFDEVFILVTNKKFKYSYKRYGTVLTRSTFRKAIERLFQ